MSDDSAVARLRTLGLNLYESRAYLALLKAKQLTAKGVGESTLIPQSRTYDVLESLTKKGFALATPSSPPAYVPVAPEKILRSCYDTERKKFQERATRVDEEAQAKLEALREAYLTLTSDFPASHQDQGANRDRVWVIQERENIENTLVGLIKDSKSQVLRITKPPELRTNGPFDPFYILRLENQKFVSDALKRRVQMKWLSLSREIPTYVGLTLTEPPERRYLERDDEITEKFLLVDNHAVLLNLHDPMSSAYGDVAVAMQSRAVSSVFQDHFEKMWARGRPLAEVLPRMKLLVEDACKGLRDIGLSRTELTVYATLAKTGALTQDALASETAKKRIQPQEAQASCDRLIRLGLLHRVSVHKLFLVEHPSNVLASISDGQLLLDSRKGLTTRPASSGKNA